MELFYSFFRLFHSFPFVPYSLFIHLKQILQRELNLPLSARAGVGRASDRADGRIGQALHREEEVRMIGQVEDLGAELERLAFGDAEETRDAEVEAMQPVTAQYVSPRVSERAGGGTGERR